MQNYLLIIFGHLGTVFRDPRVVNHYSGLLAARQ